MLIDSWTSMSLFLRLLMKILLIHYLYIIMVNDSDNGSVSIETENFIDGSSSDTLVLVNYDWINLDAKDLFVVFSSFDVKI